MTFDYFFYTSLSWHDWETIHQSFLGIFLVKLLNKLYFFLQAFAWFSDLLVEHSEIFWSLFGVDMDTVLSEQPPDT